MSDFLVNLARRGAGLAPYVAPQPPFSPSFVPEVGAARTVPAPEARNKANAHMASVVTPPPQVQASSAIGDPPLATMPAITQDVNAVHAVPAPEAESKADAYPATKTIPQMQASPLASAPPLTTAPPQPAPLPHSPTPLDSKAIAAEPSPQPKPHTPTSPRPTATAPAPPTQPQSARYPTPKPEIDPATMARLASTKSAFAKKTRSPEHAPHDTPIQEFKTVRPQSAGQIAEPVRPPQDIEIVTAPPPTKASAGKKHPSAGKKYPSTKVEPAANQVVIKPAPVIEHPPTPSTPRPPAATKPEPRPVHVRIGTVEVQATTPQPPAPPPPAAPQGFENYVSIRTYTSWEMD